MKILILSSHTQSLFWFRADMMSFFFNKGHHIIAVGPESENEWQSNFDSIGVRYRQIDVTRNGVNPLNDLKTYLSVRKVLQEEKPDKIFVYQAKTIAYGVMAANHLGISEVYPMVAGLGSIFRGSGLKNKVIKFVMSRLYRNAFSVSKKIIFQNNDDLNEIVNLGLVDKTKCTIVNGSGVNIERFTKTELPEKFTFLYIGRLIKDKGISEYLEACNVIKSKYPDVRCLLVGPFDTNPSALKPEELQVYIDNGIIEFFGEQKDVRPYINQCSVYVLPSYHEGTPKTVLESMAMGRAIITSDAPGCRETVQDNLNGFLVPVKDVSALVDKMEILINDQIKLQMFANESYKIALDKYDVNKVNASICAIMNID